MYEEGDVNEADADGMRWSAERRPEWDATPGAYVEAGVVEWGRSRRLGKFVDETLRLKAYTGVQHYDPARWYVAGEPQAKFFLSLFLNGRTVTLRTFPTLPAALAALGEFREQVRARAGGAGGTRI